MKQITLCTYRNLRALLKIQPNASHCELAKALDVGRCQVQNMMEELMWYEKRDREAVDEAMTMILKEMKAEHKLAA